MLKKIGVKVSLIQKDVEHDMLAYYKSHIKQPKTPTMAKLIFLVALRKKKNVIPLRLWNSITVLKIKGNMIPGL